MPDNFHQKAIQCLLQIGERLRNEAVDESPKQSTDMARSIIVEPGRDLTVMVGPATDYALYVHEGTGLYGPKHARYTIVPRGGSAGGRRNAQGRFVAKSAGKKVLRFAGRGQIVFARAVSHPGIHPNPFMDRSWDKISDWAHEKLANDLGDAILSDLFIQTGKSW